MLHFARFLFSPYGRLQPGPFVVAAIIVYAAGLTAQRLTEPRMLAYGLWPFAPVQAVLIWIWFVLHAKRLRDAGLGSGVAARVSLLYALSVVLLLTVGASLLDKMMAPSWGVAPTSTFGLIDLLIVNAMLCSFSILSGTLHYTCLIVAGLMIMVFAPPVMAITLTLRAATRPTEQDRKA